MKALRLPLLLLILFSFNITFCQQKLTIRPSYNCGKDALLRSLSPNNNYGTHPDFNAHAWTNSGNKVIHRSLLQFDLSAVPIGSTIISAKLSLYSYISPANGQHSKSSGSNQALLQRVTSAWDEQTVTWASQPSTSVINQVTLQETNSSSVQDFIDINITAMVQDMLNSPGQNFGIMFRLVDETIYRRMLFASSDNANASLHPKLEIDFISTNNTLTPSINLGTDTSICLNETLTLDAGSTNIENYQWQDSSTGSTFQVTKPGTYWVKVNTCLEEFSDTIIISEKNCSQIDTTIVNNKEEPLVQMSNSFTPNNDGINDVFEPLDFENIQSSSITIYNRWGLKVFYGENKNSWDGYCSGKVCPTGHYFYILKYTDLTGKHHIENGFIKLIK